MTWNEMSWAQRVEHLRPMTEEQRIAYIEANSDLLGTKKPKTRTPNPVPSSPPQSMQQLRAREAWLEQQIFEQQQAKLRELENQQIKGWTLKKTCEQIFKSRAEKVTYPPEVN